MDDQVVHPKHYNQGRIETIEVIKDSVESYSSFLEGSIIKYILRYKYKNGLEDLKKASYYLNELISEIELVSKGEREKAMKELGWNANNNAKRDKN